MPIYKRINKNFFKKWSHGMAYVLGFFAADGYITVNKRGGQFWCIQIIDRELLQSIKNITEAEHKISVRILNKSSLYRLQVGSIEMCNDLRKLGFSENKTKSLAIPSIPKKYFSDFVRGYFDGDGNIWQGEIHKERSTKHVVLQLVFTSCSLKFLEILHKELVFHGLKGGFFYNSKKKNFFRLQFSTGDALKLYNFMYNSSIQENKLFLSRKKAIFEKYMCLRS